MSMESAGGALSDSRGDCLWMAAEHLQRVRMRSQLVSSAPARGGYSEPTSRKALRSVSCGLWNTSAIGRGFSIQ